MSYLEARRLASQQIIAYAALIGVDANIFHNGYDGFSRPNRWIDFWLTADRFGYHLCGAIATLPMMFEKSQSEFRNVWDEAGSVTDVRLAFALLQSWIIDNKEIDELTERTIHRCML